MPNLRAFSRLLVPALALAASATLAQPALASPPVTVHYTRPDAAGGSDCSWDHQHGCSYVRAQVALIDAVPAWKGKGARPRVLLSLYSSNQPALTDATVRAARRGVAVELLTWRLKSKDREADPDGDDVTGERARMVRLLSGFPQDRVTVCSGGCHAGGHAGRMHAKLTATWDGAKSYRVMSGSGNSVMWTDDDAWNDWTLLTSKVHFEEVSDYFASGARDRKPKHVAKSRTSGGVTLYLFPGSVDPLLARLKACRPSKATWVDVSMWQAGDSSRVKRYVSELVRIERKGHVRVVADSSVDSGGVPNWSVKVVRRLQAGGVEVRDGHGPKGAYVNHEKSTTISGCGKADGDYRGGTNWKQGANNDEQQVWLAGPKAAKAARAHNDLVASYSKEWK